MSTEQTPTTPKPLPMSKMQRQCLEALSSVTRPDGEWCASFAYLQEVAGLPRTDVKRSVRALARKGLAEFHKGLSNEDGEFVGAGYCISRAGREIANAE